jgi:signal transduction histidine kinase
MMGKSRYRKLPDPNHTLQAHAIVWIILPLALIVSGLVIAGILSYRRVVVQLLINNQSQLAVAAATNISQVIDGTTMVLEALANNPDIYNESMQVRSSLLEDSARSLDIFTAGVLLVDPSGKERAELSFGQALEILDLIQADYFLAARSRRLPAVGNTLLDRGGGQPAIIIAAPIYDESEAFQGALLGGIYMSDARLTGLLRNLLVGTHSFAYLVDRNGQVLYHTSPELTGDMGLVLSSIDIAPFEGQGGLQWKDASGESFLIGYAPVTSAGWGLVVQEPWDSVTTPARNYSYLLVLAGLAALITVLFLGWLGVKRIVTPIQALSDQARQLVTVDGVEPVAESGIAEIDTLEQSFDHMARQIASYRLGMRRYIGAITQKQENERRHIARELHDETVQSLLAISRSIELEQASQIDPDRLKHLAEIQQLVGETLAGVRQISRDLRPLVLEDLGLIPALQALVRSARQGPGAIPHVKLDVPDQQIRLDASQELALYRIVQEALTNARKHAQATGVQLSLQVAEASIILEIEDDGIGFQVPESLSELAQHGCFGLVGIQERVWEMGGSLQIRSAPGEGTCLHISMPVVSVN